MPPDNRENDGKKQDNISLFYGFALAWQLGFLIIAPLLAFLFGGYFIDKWLKTTPLFIIIGAILALAVSVYEIYHTVKPMLEKSRKDLENITRDKENPK